MIHEISIVIKRKICIVFKIFETNSFFNELLEKKKLHKILASVYFYLLIKANGLLAIQVDHFWRAEQQKY